MHCPLPGALNSGDGGGQGWRLWFGGNLKEVGPEQSERGLSERILVAEF